MKIQLEIKNFTSYRTTKLLFLCLLLTAQIVQAKLPEGYKISKLQNPYADTYMEAYEINDQGFIVGGYYLANQDRIGGGVIWKEGEIQSMGPIGGPIYDHINNKGDVADSRNNVAFVNSRPYFFNSAKIVDLNDNGIILLSNVSDTEYGKRTSPCLFDGYTGKYLSRPGFNYNAYSFYGCSINNSNKTVGVSIYYDPPLRRYTSSCPAVWDGTYSPDDAYKIPNSFIAEFIDINDNGIVLGDYWGAGMKSFLWTKEDGIISYIGGKVNAETYCYCINNINQVVGWMGNESFVWDTDDGLVLLMDLLPGNSGWKYLTAIDINNSGTMIGTGVFNGNYECFIMEPIPEPASLLLLGFGILTLRLKKGRASCVGRRTNIRNHLPGRTWSFSGSNHNLCRVKIRQPFSATSTSSSRRTPSLPGT